MQAPTEKETATLLGAFPGGVVACDLETTGLSPLVDKVVEVGAFKIDADGRPAEFSQLINPGVEIPVGVVRIHGIDNAMVADCPAIETVLPAFWEFVGSSALVAHNARFDSGFLVFNSHIRNLPMPPIDLYCSLKMARKVFRPMPDYGLASLARHLGIPLVDGHRAAPDALACLRVFARALMTGQGRPEKCYNLAEFSAQKVTVSLPACLQGLDRATAAGRQIEIKYKGGTHRGVFRPVRPLALMPLPGGNVLYAHCLLSDMRKTFYLHKIAAFSVMQELENRPNVKLCISH